MAQTKLTVQVSDSIFPVDREEENDVFLLAVLPKFIEHLRATECKGFLDDVVAMVAIGRILKEQGRVTTDDEHKMALLEDYKHMLAGG